MDSDLYTKVETKLDTNIFSYPKGLLNGYNSKIEYVSVTSHYTGTETDDGVYYSAGWAFYMWDGSHYPSNDTYKKIDLSGYSKSNLKKWSSLSSKGRRGSISAPRHVQQAKSASLLNPVSSIFAGGAAIFRKLRGKRG